MKKSLLFPIISALIVSTILIACSGNNISALEGPMTDLLSDTSISYSLITTVAAGGESYQTVSEFTYSGDSCIMILNEETEQEMVNLCHPEGSYYCYTKDGIWAPTNSPLNLSYPWKNADYTEHCNWPYTISKEDRWDVYCFTYDENSTVEYYVAEARIDKIVYTTVTSLGSDQNGELSLVQANEFVLHEISDDEASLLIQSHIANLELQNP